MDEDRIIALLIESKLSVQYCVLYKITTCGDDLNNMKDCALRGS
jgi:hypothetical protein